MTNLKLYYLINLHKEPGIFQMDKKGIFKNTILPLANHKSKKESIEMLTKIYSSFNFNNVK